jgi:hypothetical protein
MISKVILLALAGRAAATTCAEYVSANPCTFPYNAADTSKSSDEATTQAACCKADEAQTCKELECDTKYGKYVHFKPDYQSQKCNTDPLTLCNPTDCCEVEVVLNDVTPTTTFTPWDSSLSSGDSNSLESSYSDSSLASNHVDVWKSVESSGSNASGSAGSYLPLWLWALLGLACCLCLAALLPLMGKKPKKKVTPKPKPPPPVEEEVLLPPLVPFEPPMMTSYVQTMPMTTAYAQPMPMQYVV